MNSVSVFEEAMFGRGSGWGRHVVYVTWLQETTWIACAASYEPLKYDTQNSDTHLDALDTLDCLAIMPPKQ